MLFASTPSTAEAESTSLARERLSQGVLWGVVATAAMSLPMIAGMATGAAPMPEPIPKALVELVVTGPMPLVMGLAAVSHLAYGGLWGAVLTQITPHVTIWKGVGLGLFLWACMQVAVLPLLGWGLFGAAITPKIAVATLLLHLVYGGFLGWELGH